MAVSDMGIKTEDLGLFWIRESIKKQTKQLKAMENATNTHKIKGVRDLMALRRQHIQETMVLLRMLEGKPLRHIPEDCQSKVDGLCLLPPGSCKQCDTNYK